MVVVVVVDVGLSPKRMRPLIHLACAWMSGEDDDNDDNDGDNDDA